MKNRIQNKRRKTEIRSRKKREENLLKRSQPYLLTPDSWLLYSVLCFQFDRTTVENFMRRFAPAVFVCVGDSRDSPDLYRAASS
jgi:hypothetical protein